MCARGIFKIITSLYLFSCCRAAHSEIQQEKIEQEDYAEEQKAKKIVYMEDDAKEETGVVMSFCLITCTEEHLY